MDGMPCAHLSPKCAPGYHDSDRTKCADNELYAHFGGGGGGLSAHVWGVPKKSFLQKKN